MVARGCGRSFGVDAGDLRALAARVAPCWRSFGLIAAAGRTKGVAGGPDGDFKEE